MGDNTEASSGFPGNTAAEKLAALRKDPAVSKLPAIGDNRIVAVTAIEMDAGVRSVNIVRALVDGVRRFGHAG
jgi:iron complex transport system substrate-binding protein